MRIQDHTIEATREAQEEAFRYARAVPDDRLEWQPEGQGQTVLSMAREIAKCADWAYDLLATGSMDYSEEGNAETAGWKTIADCEAAGKEKLGRYFEFLKGIPDERLTETMELPFGPGGSMKRFTLGELMDYPRWNSTYHLGQIAYVQTLYGDRGMH